MFSANCAVNLLYSDIRTISRPFYNKIKIKRDLLKMKPRRGEPGTKNIVGSKVVAIRKERKITQEQLGQLAGIAKSTISNYEQGTREPNVVTINKLANILNVTGDELLGLNVNKLHIIINNAQKQHLEEFDKLNVSGQEKATEYVRDLTQISQYQKKLGKNEISSQSEFEGESVEMVVYNIAAAAGFGNYLFDDDNNYETFKFPADSVPYKADFGIRISGNSMEPNIENGSIVWVREQIQLENGQIGIFVIDDEAYCKKIEIDHNAQQIRLVSLNPEYKPIIIRHNQIFRTIGKVLL